MKTKKPKYIPLISFWVVAITQRRNGSVTYFETELETIGTGQKLVIRGNPWRIGAKVDFQQLKAENP